MATPRVWAIWWVKFWPRTGGGRLDTLIQAAPGCPHDIRKRRPRVRPAGCAPAPGLSSPPLPVDADQDGGDRQCSHVEGRAGGVVDLFDFHFQGELAPGLQQ